MGCVHNAKFATSELNPNLLAVAYEPLDMACIGSMQRRVDITYNQRSNWDNLSTQVGSFKGGFKFSLVDSNIFYTGAVTLHKNLKTNPGSFVLDFITNTTQRAGQPHDPFWVHDDIRTIQLLNINGKEVFFIGHDGGVSKSYGICEPAYRSNGLCWKNISDSLTNSQFHGIALHEDNENLFYGGAQDGTNIWTTNNGQNWTAGSLAGGIGDFGDALYRKQNQFFDAFIMNGGVHKSPSSPNNIYPQPGSLQSRLKHHPNNPNIIYAGVADLVRSDLNSSSNIWKVALEINNANNRGSSVNDFAICESQPNFKIVATDNTTHNSGITEGLLFKTDVENPNPISSWNDITPDIPNIVWGQINTVTMDPNNPDRIWIGVSGFSNSPNKERIFYTSMGGTDDSYPGGWVDFSAGLPNLPIQEIHYQKGSNDLLFVATDVGVFYRNANMSQWECYSNGLPPGIVNDVDFSYCTDKMAISVYGRGAYTNTILNLPWEINSNTLWDNKRWLSVDLRIKSGATLTISDTLFIYPNVKITVERGGKLIVDGGTLTTTCQDRFWHGIEVHGDANQWQQVAGIQGEIIIKNDALIEHAREAIVLIKTDNTGNQDFGYTGGIIRASNSTFRNCKRAISFYSYHNTAGGVVYQNQSFFRNVIFETTAQLKENSNPYAFVSLHDVDKITFSKCIFRNLVPQLYNENNRGVGIKSWDATYSLLPKCGSVTSANTPCPIADIEKNEFRSLTYGIEAKALNPMNPFTVDYTIFDNCIKAIFQKGVNFTSVTRSEFILPAASIYDVYGVYTEGCYGYQIEENSFIGPGSSADRTSGICIYQSGQYVNEVYKNYFNDLFVGVLIMEENGIQQISGEGLELLCNNFSSFEYAIALTNNASIDYNQGSVNKPTGNSFTPECYAGLESELYVDPTAHSFEYFHHQDFFAEPLCYSSPAVMPVNTGISYNGCSSRLDPFCPDCNISNPGLNRIKPQIGITSIRADVINSQIRAFYKDTILSNARNSTINYLTKNSLGLISDYIITGIELQKGNFTSFRFKSAAIKAKGAYLPLLDIFDYLENGNVFKSNALAKNINNLISRAAISKGYGYANGENLLTYTKDNNYQETLVYPITSSKLKRQKNNLPAPEIELDSIQVFPNPTKDIISISLYSRSNQIKLIKFLTSGGSLIKEITTTDKIDTFEVNVSDWAEGIYFIQIENNDKTRSIKKIVIIK